MAQLKNEIGNIYEYLTVIARAENDKMKKEYCKNHNIPLIKIKYKKNYNLKIEDLRLEEIDGLQC